MPTYETLFITPPTLPEEDEREAVEVLSRIVTEGGGSFTINDRMGRRRLAYPIEKFEDGVYTRFLYDADPEVPRELERRLRLSDKVLRALTVRLKDEWAGEIKAHALREAQRRLEAEAEERRRAEEQEREAEARAKEAAAEPAGEAGEAEPDAEKQAAATTEEEQSSSGSD